MMERFSKTVTCKESKKLYKMAREGKIPTVKNRLSFIIKSSKGKVQWLTV